MSFQLDFLRKVVGPSPVAVAEPSDRQWKGLAPAHSP